MKCYYELLSVPLDADADEIKKAYRKAALLCHPGKIVKFFSLNLFKG